MSEKTIGYDNAMGVQQVISDEREPARHLMTVEEFLILDKAGAFEDIGHVALIEGEMSPLFRPHGAAVVHLTVAFSEGLRWIASPLGLYAGLSAHLDDHNLPEGDLVIATDDGTDFATPQSARLLVEVSYSSLAHDLSRKAALYARSGIPEYWVADVKGRKIVRMFAPAGAAYTVSHDFAFGERIPSATIADLVIDTAALA